MISINRNLSMKSSRKLIMKTYSRSTILSIRKKLCGISLSIVLGDHFGNCFFRKGCAQFMQGQQNGREIGALMRITGQQRRTGVA